MLRTTEELTKLDFIIFSNVFILTLEPRTGWLFTARLVDYLDPARINPMRVRPDQLARNSKSTRTLTVRHYLLRTVLKLSRVERITCNM